MKVLIRALDGHNLAAPLPDPPYVEINSFEDILELMETYGEELIISTHKTRALDGVPTITIYNDYNE